MGKKKIKTETEAEKKEKRKEEKLTPSHPNILHTDHFFFSKFTVSEFIQKNKKKPERTNWKNRNESFLFHLAGGGKIFSDLSN